MINLELKLTVDDLIVEYMIYKVKNGYEPSFLTSEFVSFLYFFEEHMKVEDSIHENERLFRRFFERKNKEDWNTPQKGITPHMTMEYSPKDSDYLIKANYLLNDGDYSRLNTYYMDYGLGQHGKGTTKKIRDIIAEYVSSLPKRTIPEIEIEKTDLQIGKNIAAKMIEAIWQAHIQKQMEYGKWPKQCTDISQYLIDLDLAEIIQLKSIKSDLLELYKVLSTRIASLYHLDKNLKIGTSSNFLARSNYELISNGYAWLTDLAFHPSKGGLEIDLEKGNVRMRKISPNPVYEGDDSDEITISSPIEDEKAKQIVKKLDTIIQ